MTNSPRRSPVLTRSLLDSVEEGAFEELGDGLDQRGRLNQRAQRFGACFRTPDPPHSVSGGANTLGCFKKVLTDLYGRGQIPRGTNRNHVRHGCFKGCSCKYSRNHRGRWSTCLNSQVVAMERLTETCIRIPGNAA